MDSSTVLSIYKTISFLEWSEINIERLLSLGNSLHTKRGEEKETKDKITERFGLNILKQRLQYKKNLQRLLATPPIAPPNCAMATKKRSKQIACGYMINNMSTGM